MLLHKIKMVLTRLGFRGFSDLEASRQARKSNIVIWDLENEG